MCMPGDLIPGCSQIEPSMTRCRSQGTAGCLVSIHLQMLTRNASIGHLGQKRSQSGVEQRQASVCEEVANAQNPVSCLMLWARTETRKRLCVQQIPDSVKPALRQLQNGSRYVQVPCRPVPCSVQASQAGSVPLESWSEAGSLASCRDGLPGGRPGQQQRSSQIALKACLCSHLLKELIGPENEKPISLDGMWSVTCRLYNKRGR
jgi:hypothetical protein